MTLYLQTREGYGQPWSKPAELAQTGLELMSKLHALHRADPKRHMLVTTATGDVDHGYFPDTGYSQELPQTLEIGGIMYERV